MRGRKPVPTRLKLMADHPGKRPINHNEPQPAAAFPTCPPELGPVARAEWERLVPELGELGPLTNLDRAALAAYCGAYGLRAEAMAAIQKYGTMVKAPAGYPMQSPYIGLANRQAELMIRLSAEFGFTPASRSRISTPPELPLLTLFGLKEVP
jgi:P27 family predicted phage terminase small subunit